MLRAMNTLRCAIEENDIGEEKFSILNNLEHALSTAMPFGKQSQITDFLKND